MAGFETPFGLELLSTVHWTIARESAGSINEVVSKIYGWNDRKKQFSPRQIALAVDVLGAIRINLRRLTNSDSFFLSSQGG